jgi:hypothetical protein
LSPPGGSIHAVGPTSNKVWRSPPTPRGGSDPDQRVQAIEYERDEQETGEYQKRADGGVEQSPERLVGNE